MIDENASGDFIDTSAISFDLGLDIDLWFNVSSENGEVQNIQDEKHIEQGQGVESRFAEITVHEIDILIKETENKNTKKATKWALEDDNGNYIEFQDKDNKTYNVGLCHRYIAPKSVKHYLDMDCQILDSYNMYMNAIYEIDKSVSSPFYRRPVLSEGSVKFDHILGANRLGTLMKTICKKGRTKGNFSNHSGKRTLATRLYQAGASEQMIMDRKGHRSEKAVRTFKRPADSMLKDVSNILNPSNKQIKLEHPKTLTDNCTILPKQDNIENKENEFNESKAEGKSRGLPSKCSFQNCVFKFDIEAVNFRNIQFLT
ncbi:unnamed protein product [Mytilus coruscus]|uniref:DUF3504 domain-containing protein n=1 Tax=Mytilus coruscus TaxID=42192 RepID=A0A6J8B5P6_MYTCO|nr:unnamed protein product [Mytilus coruscus]